MRWGFFIIFEMVKAQFYNLIYIHIIKRKVVDVCVAHVSARATFVPFE